MKKSRFTEMQIVGILKEGDSGLPLQDLRFLQKKKKVSGGRPSERFKEKFFG